MGLKEPVCDFFERFESLIRDYESCENPVESTEIEKQSAFYQAVVQATSEIRTAEIVTGQRRIS